MPLEVGSQIAHYTVDALIGEGGMGQVWQASDTKLNRQVALKILTDAFAADPDRLARFQREAQVLASLNHPGIAQIHGLEEQDGTKALVLELVEGPTLADRIAQGPISVDEVLPIAKQIAEALEAAHEQGIIHRDLKPANIKLRPDGTVKVLDFGLAKALDTVPEGDPNQSPTLTAAATQMGVIMGTAAYMSPEQARGKPVDKRADIWAFGVVLYEMLTGQRPFHGEDVSLILASVMKSDINVAVLPADLPGTLRTVIRQCLQKDPKQRIRDIGDVRLAMDGTFETRERILVAGARQPGMWRALGGALAALVVGAVVGGVTVWRLGSSSVVPLVRFDVQPAGTMVFPRGASAIALSPDGTRLVYEADNQLYMRMLDQPEPMPIRGTEDGTAPFFSPDGQWLAFFTATQLKKIPIGGGVPSVLCDVGNGLGGTWGPDGTIVYGVAALTNLSMVPDVGGTPTPFSTRLDGDMDHDYPTFLPGGDAVLFSVTTEASSGLWDDAQLVVQSLETGEREVVLEGGYHGRFVPTGHLVYARGGSLMAVRFDTDTLTATGSPVPVVERVWQRSTGVQFTLSGDGILAFVPGESGPGRRLTWVDREGRPEPLDAEPGNYSQVKVSPDGLHMAVSMDGDVQTYDTVRGALNRVTTSPADDRFPLWTPDGRRIVFESNRGGTRELFVTTADGTSVPERILALDEDVLGIMPDGWAADGVTLVFTVGSSGPAGFVGNIGTLSLDEDGAADLLIEDEFLTMNAAISPDDAWIAYASNLSGRTEVYVQRFPELGDRHRISTSGGVFPRWSADGTELFYQSVDGRRVFVVPIQRDPSFRPGVPEPLFEGEYLPQFDLSSTGDRFALISVGDRSGSVEPPQIAVVQGWFDELERLMPLD